LDDKRQQFDGFLTVRSTIKYYRDIRWRDSVNFGKAGLLKFFTTGGKCRPPGRIDFHSLVLQKTRIRRTLFVLYDGCFEARKQRTIMQRIFRECGFCHKRNWKLRKMNETEWP